MNSKQQDYWATLWKNPKQRKQILDEAMAYAKQGQRGVEDVAQYIADRLGVGKLFKSYGKFEKAVAGNQTAMSYMNRPINPFLAMSQDELKLPANELEDKATQEYYRIHQELLTAVPDLGEEELKNLSMKDSQSAYSVFKALYKEGAFQPIPQLAQYLKNNSNIQSEQASEFLCDAIFRLQKADFKLV